MTTKIEEKSLLTKTYNLCREDRMLMIYLIGVIFQTGHTIEHYTQVIQRFWLGLPAAESHGLIGQLDLEIVHLVWNLAVLAFLVYAHYGFGLNNPDSRLRKIPMFYAISVFNLIFQGYHTIEHIVRAIQFFGFDIRPAPGILGYFLLLNFGIDAVILMHFFINLIVYPLMVVFALIYIIHEIYLPLRDGQI